MTNERRCVQDIEAQRAACDKIIQDKETLILEFNQQIDQKD